MAQKFKLGLLLLSNTSILITSSVWAQQDDENPRDEIIVTAQKRAQDVQDVPIAMTAISGVELENNGVPDVSELGMIAPSLRITTSTSESFGSVLRIRGVGTSGSNAGLEGSVGVFVDGIYRSRTGIAMNDLINVERIEVLRGAQGTLFGKNTSAGAIHILTKKPEFKFGGSVDASYGNYNAKKIRGTITGPLIEDKLAVRLSGTFNKRDGFITDVPTGRKFNDRDRFVLRGQALLTPNDNMDFRLIIDYSEKDENCCASPFKSYGATQAVIAGLGGTVIPAGEFSRDIAVDGDFVNTAEDFGTSLEFNWRGNNTSFTSLTSWRNYQAFGLGDVDRNAIDVADNTTDIDVETFTQEFRLQGTQGRLDWMVGAYYFDENISRESSIVYGSQAGAWFASLVPGFLRPLVSTLYPEGGGAVSNLFAQDTTGWALFTHNVIEVTPKLDVILGARFSHESKDGSGTFVTNSPSCTTFSPTSPLAALRVLCPVPDFNTK
ncbi:MAG TPA: TonB-dependent receptor, partial [Hellea balneolensis]|nr:TonB-dependent receptor [Hellea balneolensis]